ncbi:MAG: hypothetical protein U9O87_10990 [Verrucomicrobiota bacterium]|nr:hypothetical protein [Verrucomicrobiota bacterium]
MKKNKNIKQSIINDKWFLILNSFSMIEVVLAMGVIAIGFTAIMGLFPVGLNANRDAVAENFAAHQMDTLLSYMAVQAENNWGVVSSLPATKPNSGDEDERKYALLDDNFPTIYADKTKDVYWIYAWQGNGVSDDPDSLIDESMDENEDGIIDSGVIVDFSGVARIWKTDIDAEDYKYYTTAGAQDYDPGIANACILNLELSWPSQVPYNKRQKAYYSLEVRK